MLNHPRASSRLPHALVTELPPQKASRATNEEMTNDLDHQTDVCSQFHTETKSKGPAPWSFSSPARSIRPEVIAHTGAGSSENRTHTRGWSQVVEAGPGRRRSEFESCLCFLLKVEVTLLLCTSVSHFINRVPTTYA